MPVPTVHSVDAQPCGGVLPSPDGEGKQDANKRLSTVISAGGGRLHFLQTANALYDAGVDTSLILGIVPHPRLERVYSFLGHLLGRRNLGAALKVRVADCRLPRAKILSCAFAETVIYAAMTLSRFGLFPESLGQALGWKVFGRSTRKYLGKANVFHVRSGAGQGGAINTARQRGMKVIVDHSIAHPAHMQRALAPGFARRGEKFWFSPKMPFWKVVLEDCAQADLLLVNSDFVRETFIAEGFPESRIAVAYLGVPPEFCRLKKNYNLSATPRFLFTGSFSSRKGADTLLATLKVLREQGQPCELHVVGPTPEQNLLEVPARDSTRVFFHGIQPQKELKSWLANCDLYVFPTLAEGCAKSAMEAMAAGLPVVTTAACGLPGVPNEHYLLTPPESSEILAGKIIELLADAGRRESIGVSGADLVADRYQWKNYAEAVRTAYVRCLQSSR